MTYVPAANAPARLSLVSILPAIHPDLNMPDISSSLMHFPRCIPTSARSTPSAQLTGLMEWQ